MPTNSLLLLITTTSPSLNDITITLCCAQPATTKPITTRLPSNRLLLPCHFLNQHCLLPSSPSWNIVSQLLSNVSVEGAIQWRPHPKKPWTALHTVQDLVTHILKASREIVADTSNCKNLHPVNLTIKKEVIVSEEELERMVRTRTKEEREDRIVRNIVKMVLRYGIQNLDEELSEHVRESPGGTEVKFLRPLNLIFSENMEVARAAFVTLVTEFTDHNHSEELMLNELTESDHLLNKLRRWGVEKKLEEVKKRLEEEMKINRRKMDGEMCAVCLEKYEEESEVRHMELCEHSFHRDCIVEWLTKQRTCPLCRSKLRCLEIRLRLD